MNKGNLVTGRTEESIDVLDREIFLIPEGCEIRHGLDSELTSKLRICSYTVVLPGHGWSIPGHLRARNRSLDHTSRVFHPTRITHIHLTSVSENPRPNYGFRVRMFRLSHPNCINSAVQKGKSNSPNKETPPLRNHLTN
jgi:hypothetical protein